MTALSRGIALMFALQVGHALDHILIQPSRDYAWETHVPGAISFVVLAVVFVLVRRGSRFGPPAAVLSGLAYTFGFAAVHLAPHWSAFSDPYPPLTLDPVSWAFVFVPMALGLVIAALGLREGRLHAPAQPA